MSCRVFKLLTVFLILIGSGCVSLDECRAPVLSDSLSLCGGEYVSVEFAGDFTSVEEDNAHPIGALRVSFSDSRGNLLRTGDCGLYGCGRGNGTVAFEYLYGAPNVTNSQGRVEWRFKVKSPNEAKLINVDIRTVRPRGPVLFGNLRVRGVSSTKTDDTPKEEASDAYELPRVGAGWDVCLEVDGGDSVTVSGTALPSDHLEARAGIVLVRFEGSNGVIRIESGVSYSDRFGNYFYLPVGRKPVRFVKKFKVPKAANIMKVGAFSFKETCRLDNRLKVAVAAASTGGLPTEDFFEGCLEDIIKDKTVPEVVRPVNTSFLPQNWKETNFDRTLIAFEHFGAIRISEDMDWNANPMNSNTWLSNLNSGYWIPVMGRGLELGSYYAHCRKYWMSFLKQQGSNTEKYHVAYCEHCCAARIEAILTTLFGIDLGQGKFHDLPALTGSLAAEPDLKKRLLMQLARDVEEVSYHLRARSMGVHNHNVLMARSLLQFADCFSKYGFSGKYRRLALRVLLEHLDEMFEADGFIREQSVAYHLTFTGYFVKVYDYLRANKSCDQETLAVVRKKVDGLVDVCFSLVPPDGLTPPMGDAAVTDMRQALVGMVATLDGVSKTHAESLVDERLNNLREYIAYEKSGIYLFRNLKAARMVLIDLSEVLKVHGHYDLGSWMYFSGTNRWVTDPGGPYQYGSKTHRCLRQSTGHSLMEPYGFSQTSGSAYDVQMREDSVGYVLSYRDNVYAPEFEHERAFLLLKDLSAIRVIDTFRSRQRKPTVYLNRFVSGVSDSVAMATGKMAGTISCPSGEKISFEFSGDAGKMNIGVRQISPDYNVLRDADDVTLQIDSEDGFSTSVLDLGEQSEFDRLSALSL